MLSQGSRFATPNTQCPMFQVPDVKWWDIERSLLHAQSVANSFAVFGYDAIQGIPDTHPLRGSVDERGVGHLACGERVVGENASVEERVSKKLDRIIDVKCDVKRRKGYLVSVTD